MAKFGLYTNQGEKITTSYHKDLREALEHHSKLKQLPLDVFVNLFQVKEEKNETRSTKS
tara:strand:- start:128 stop:304 length:177 start_codon:yes stop_codon:yes gene_type:complete